jgi:ribosomal protein L40E
VDCGARNEGSARYCMECGGLLPSPGEELRCLGCNAQLPLKAKFCPRCGAKAAV